jgi:hypothetical protein
MKEIGNFALNVASSNDTLFVLSTKITASLNPMISHVALRECETWSPALKKEHAMNLQTGAEEKVLT